MSSIHGKRQSPRSAPSPIGRVSLHNFIGSPSADAHDDGLPAPDWDALRALALSSFSPRLRPHLTTFRLDGEPVSDPSVPAQHGPAAYTEVTGDQVECHVSLYRMDRTLIDLVPGAKDDSSRLDRLRKLSVLHETAHCEYRVALCAERSGDENGWFLAASELDEHLQAHWRPQGIAESIVTIVMERHADAKALLHVAALTVCDSAAGGDLAARLSHFEDYARDQAVFRAAGPKPSNFWPHDTLCVVETVLSIVRSACQHPRRMEDLRKQVADPHCATQFAQQLALGSVAAGLERHERDLVTDLGGRDTRPAPGQAFETPGQGAVPCRLSNIADGRLRADIDAAMATWKQAQGVLAMSRERERPLLAALQRPSSRSGAAGLKGSRL